MENTIKDTSFGCDNCTMLTKHRCKLWEVKVNEPHDSSCESGPHMTRVYNERHKQN